MDMQHLNKGQAVEYYAYSDAGGWRWRHGHVSDVDNHPRFPAVFIDTTMYDYRPQSAVVEPHRVRPATTECTSTASCQSTYAQRPRS